MSWPPVPHTPPFALVLLWDRLQRRALPQGCSPGVSRGAERGAGGFPRSQLWSCNRLFICTVKKWVNEAGHLGTSRTASQPGALCVCFYVLLLNSKVKYVHMGLPRGLSDKESTCQAGDAGLIPGWGRCPGEENGNPLQWVVLGNPVRRGAWQAAVNGLTKSWTQPERLISGSRSSMVTWF